MKIIDYLFRKTCWYVAYRKSENQNGNSLSFDGDWKIINIPKRYWIADPFLIRHDDKSFLFCEMMDRKVSHGKIGYAEIPSRGKVQVRELMDVGCHASYPNIFQYKNVLYLVPETSEKNLLEIYRCISFPNKWERSELLFNTNTVDSTIFIKDDIPFVFLYEGHGDKNVLKIGIIDFENMKVTDITKVKEYNLFEGRPAGNIFRIKDTLVRPTQYSKDFYGEKIIFKTINIDYKKGEIKYNESDFFEVSAQDLKFETEYEGIHTYNSDGYFDVIDLQKKRFYLFRPIQAVLKKLKLMGYRTDKNYK